MARTRNTPNDPRRRERIAAAAMRLLEDGGVDAVTARAVAASAHVPVGSVSYYFPSVRALLLEASRRVADLRADSLAQWSDTVTADTLIGALAELIHAQITTGRGLTVVAYELYILGLRDEEFRSVAETVNRALRDALAHHLPADTADHLAATAEGLQLAALVRRPTPNTAALVEALRGRAETQP
nr:TetR family transcriptional regulator [Actinomyces sp.]